MLITQFTCYACGNVRRVNNDGQQPAYFTDINGNKICATCLTTLTAAKLPPFTFETEAQYIDAREKNDAYYTAVRAWLTEHKTNGMPNEVAATMPFANEVTNEMRSQIEVWEFLHKPIDKYFLYINEKNNTATTWTGSVLGIVNFHVPFKDNFGGTRQHINVYGIDGKKYYGTYYKSSGSYARIKLAKK